MHAFHKEEWRHFKLIDKKELSKDVRLFRFALPSDDHIIGLPVGQHISLKYVDENNKDVIRSYTPISSNKQKGIIDFAIKVYFKNEHPNFPEGGKMSQHLNSLNINDSILMKGPKGHVEYLGRGRFSITKNQITKEVKVSKLGLIAGGTGITPMLQVMNAIVEEIIEGGRDNDIEIFLIFANQTENDIFLRHEIENLANKLKITKHKHPIRIWYTVDKASSPDWSYSTGFVNTAMCRKHLPAPSPDSFLFVCGPPPMIKHACEPAFAEIGYKPEQWFAF